MVLVMEYGNFIAVNNEQKKRNTWEASIFIQLDYKING
jgi:hypothetical protein